MIVRQHLQIIPIPAFNDNYIWLLHNHRQAVVVDPGDAEPVIATLLDLQLQLDTILITHHHHDHIGGVTTLLNTYPQARVYAPKQEAYDFPHIAVAEPDTVAINILDISLAVIDVPGHTLGHIAYYLQDKRNGSSQLFCGDTLFGAGCGRLFEGTPAQMYHSLQKLTALPPHTEIYCTHEYTLHNLDFAMTLEPNNPQLQTRQFDTLQLRQHKQPSLPSTLQQELATNPFLRCDSSEIKASIQLHNADALQVFTTIRELRNHY
jgi:hydroxyacylglutathione hydrolase